MMVMKKIGKMTTEVLGEILFYSPASGYYTISSLVLLLKYFPKQFQYYRIERFWNGEQRNCFCGM